MASKGSKICVGEIFHPWAFLLSLGIGFLAVYIMAPEPTVIVRYPTPQNAGQEIYEDKAGQCYKYDVKTVECPANAAEIQQVRIVN